MRNAAVNILRWIPCRRGRHWRYVSPHRRGAGVVILALLTVGVLAYWLLPRGINDWTRRQAGAYLCSFTGGRVVVRDARFSFFGGIELRGVTLDVPNSPSREPLLAADTVVLRHRPWSLFTRGTVEPTEIVCIAPTVTLEYDAQKGRYTAEELISAMRRRPAGAPKTFKGQLPVISIRDVRLRLLTGETRLNISMLPGDGAYRIMLAQQDAGGREPLRGTWRLDLATGRLDLEESNIPKIAYTDSILPERYSKWRKRYDIRGKVVLKGRPATAPAAAVLEAELDNVSLKLPPAQGGLALAGVRGTLIFHAACVEARGLTGNVPQAGGAVFRMSGRYGGYDANSPFDLRIVVEGMALPDGSGATGWLADRVKFLHRAFRPAGRLDIEADLKRLPGGRIDLKGQAQPKGMSFVYKWVPYRVDGVTGTIAFQADASADRVFLRGIKGRRGDAEMTVRGEVDLRRKWHYDVTVGVKRAVLDTELRDALPKEFAGIWNYFRPSGTAGATVRVWKEGTGRPQSVEATLVMDGEASMTCKGFPYRVEALTGELRMAKRLVTVDSVRGRHGPMRCTIDGTAGGWGETPGETNLTIEATDVPLDANLIAALPAHTRKAAASMHATGLAERVSARVRQLPGKPLDLRAVARLRGASLRPDAFPYALTDATGLLTIRGDRVIVEELHGRHGAARIDANGQVLLAEDTPHVDLHVRAAGLTLDEDLFAALPAEAKRVWRRLAASGRADAELSLRHPAPGGKGRPHYRLHLRPRGMQVRYCDFPYTLRDVVGEAVATPGGVVLTGVAAAHGPARLLVNGELTIGPHGEDANLVVSGTNVPIDEELLAAMPSSLAPLARRFQPGGRGNVRLESFRISRSPAAGGPAAGTPTSSPTSRPGGNVRWSMKGLVAFNGATIDVGLGHKTLSGSLRGTASQAGQDLSLDAAIELDSVLVARQRLTKLRGRLTKKARSQLMRLNDMLAAAHGGRVAGFAEVRLADPLEFGVSLSLDGILLEDLFGADPNGAGPKAQVKGSLSGNVQLTATAGKRPERQASGVLRISKARLYKLPVMLGLLHVVYLSLPGETAFTDGNLTYHLRNDKLVFDEIYLRGPALSIVGSGTMNMKTESLDLTFLSGPPRKLPRMGGLSELLDGIAREVAQIHVGGTVRKPRMRTVPLRSLDRLVRDLMNPGR